MTELKTESEAREFWEQLDEKTRLVLAKTAPETVDIWHSIGDGKWTRLCHATVIKVISERKYIGWLHPFELIEESFDSPSSAMFACDAKLRELGFVLEGD